ncbi:MAG TPA: UDP-N-acetylmuramate dehydrogenase [Candidatus Magasanikbacteria bacterium]|nr:UDP-N-acetylmuramate dehydrogenase [Candidatus Magasanikbacteria bacterium]
MNEIIKELKKYGKVKIKESLAKHTTYRVGGPADYFLAVENIEKLPMLLGYLSGEGVSYCILGGGSNSLFSDEGFGGVVITLNDRGFVVEEDVVTASAGAILSELADATIRAGLTGFEWGVGVPGTIGGAVRGNAGVPDGEMCDVVESVRVWRDGEEMELNNSECEFGYRDSVFKHESIVIMQVRLKLTRGEDKMARQKALAYIMNRSKTQPHGMSSAGCVFKNVLRADLPVDFVVPVELGEGSKVPAGWLLDQCGLKGEKIGDAMISEKHANFIVNLGQAKAGDIQALIARAKEKVYNKYKIELEEEVVVMP